MYNSDLYISPSVVHGPSCCTAHTFLSHLFKSTLFNNTQLSFSKTMSHPRCLPTNSPTHSPPYLDPLHIKSSFRTGALLYLVFAAGLNIVWRNSNQKLQPTITTVSLPFQLLLFTCFLSRLPLWSWWACASCVGPWRVRGPGAVGGG